MLETIDIAIVALYAGALVVLAHWVSREKTGAEKNAQDYFLASKSLPWWAIGASLIAANISAEQIIGMSGSGYAIGLAIASYEWMAAITLILEVNTCCPCFYAPVSTPCRSFCSNVMTIGCGWSWRFSGSAYMYSSI